MRKLNPIESLLYYETTATVETLRLVVDGNTGNMPMSRLRKAAEHMHLHTDLCEAALDTPSEALTVLADALEEPKEMLFGFGMSDRDEDDEEEEVEDEDGE